METHGLAVVHGHPLGSDGRSGEGRGRREEEVQASESLCEPIADLPDPGSGGDASLGGEVHAVLEERGRPLVEQLTPLQQVAVGLGEL